MEASVIEQRLQEYAESVRAKDVDRFVALYADEVRVFDAWGRWSYDGADAWLQMATEWFGSLGSDQVAVEFADVQTNIGDEVAIASAFVMYKGVSADGEQLRAVDSRLTWALRKTPGGTWTIVHEHTSAPADFGTSKVQQQR